MDRFFLEEPSQARKEEALEYLKEHIEYNSDINGVGGMDKCLNKTTYEDWLIEIQKRKDKEYAYSINRVPQQTFFLIRENDNKLIGTINIRYDLTKEMLEFGGHIGYGIRPTERRKGYNKINLYLGLLKAKEIGLKKVMLDCSVTNLGSEKTIQALGGIFERSGIDPYDNELTNVYWIKVNDAIDKYKEFYAKSIIK